MSTRNNRLLTKKQPINYNDLCKISRWNSLFSRKKEEMAEYGSLSTKNCGIFYHDSRTIQMEKCNTSNNFVTLESLIPRGLKAHCYVAGWVNKKMRRNRVEQASVISTHIKIHADDKRQQDPKAQRLIEIQLQNLLLLSCRKIQRITSTTMCL